MSDRMTSVARLVDMAAKGKDWKDWYVRAGDDIASVCAQEHWDFDRFVDVLALTSPRTSVRRNIRVAIHYMQTGQWLTGVIDTTKRAMAHYLETGEIRGPKTSAFAAALKGDLSAVVLDVWMAEAFKVDQRRFDRIPVRAKCNQRIRAAAGRLCWRPAEVQAAIWATTVRDHGRRVPGFVVSDELLLPGMRR